MTYIPRITELEMAVEKEQFKAYWRTKIGKCTVLFVTQQLLIAEA